MKLESKIVLAVVAAVALSLTACEKGTLTAPADSSIAVTAADGTLNLDPNLNETEKSTAITATVFKENLAQQGVVVYMSSNGGHLASCVDTDPGNPGNACTPQGLKTDAQGTVRDVLTVVLGERDPDPIKVTAVSGTITGTVEVKKIVAAANLPPVPAVVIAPRDQQAVGKPVVFDGSATADPDDDQISCWRWTLTSSNPDPDKPNPFVKQGSAVNAFDATFANVQDMSGSLQVTDNPAYLVADGSGRTACDRRDESIVFEATAPFRYTIVRVLCTDNQAPTAVISGPDTITLVGAFNSQISLLLDGTVSSDPEGLSLDDYVWNCGNSFVAQEQQPNGEKAVCQYRVDGASVTYTATLVVKDRGTGQIDPATGGYSCQKSSAEASIKVVVQPTTAP